MGRRADTPLEVKRAEFPKPAASTLAALLNTAAEHNYDLRVRRSELEQQGLKVALAKNERYPTFTVGPALSQERASEKETIIGLSLSVPLHSTSLLPSVATLFWFRSSCPRWMHAWAC